MKTLSDHIQESFAPVKEDQQTIIENLNDNKKKLSMRMNLQKKNRLNETVAIEQVFIPIAN